MPETDLIISRDNSKLAAARRVRDGRERSLIFVEGIRLVGEALRSNIDLEICFVNETFVDETLINDAESRCRVVRVAEKAFASIADTPAPQGIVLLAKRPSYSLERIQERGLKLPVLVYLFEVNNPSNLGAVIRSAEAAGALGVVTSPASADAFSPKSLRSAMGSAFRLPVIDSVPFQALKDWALSGGYSLVATDIDGNVDHNAFEWKGRAVLVMGSEAHGLPPGIVSEMDHTVRIDMDPDVESLNLAVSAGVVLFEARRQMLSGR